MNGLKEYTSGNIKAAVSLWEKAIQLNPEHTKAKKGLERARKELR